MKDRFDEMMEMFLVPIAELGGKVIDCTYFLRKDGSLAFAQGYYHPRGMISAKILYYPKKGGWAEIFGRGYDCLHKTYRDGKMYSFTNPQQIEMHYTLFPELARSARVAPVIKNNLLMPLADFVGFFDARRSLRLCMELYPKINRGVREASELLEIPVERMGLTGSLQYGRLEEHDDDTDLIIYGTVEENYALMGRILALVREDPSRHVHEFGKFWPLRLYHGGILVCPFFVYALEGEIPLGDCRIRSIHKESRIEARITDIRHSIYMPLVFPLDAAEVDGKREEKFILILSDSYVRGEFKVGQRVKASGELVEVEKGGRRTRALIVANNWDVEKLAGEG
jgi:predicted nucleotidyltransferase